MRLFNIFGESKRDQEPRCREVRLAQGEYEMLDRHCPVVARKLSNESAGRAFQSNRVEFGGVPEDIANEAMQRLAELRAIAQHIAAGRV